MATVLTGIVIKGMSRGKDLGFPTANIPVDENIEEGIYLSKIKINKSIVIANEVSAASAKQVLDRVQSDINNEIAASQAPRNDSTWLPALTFVGKAITFNQTKSFAESYILDFSDDLYDKSITIELVQKLRDNKKFDSVEDLQQQMKEDALAARKFFSKTL